MPYIYINLAQPSVPILWHNNTLLNWCQSCHIIPQSDRFYHFTIVANLSLPLFLLSPKPQQPLCLSIPVHPLSPIINLKPHLLWTQVHPSHKHPPALRFVHFPILFIYNLFDSKDTCVIHKSNQVFSVMLVPSSTHLYTSSIPTCLYSTALSPSPCRFIHQLLKVSSSQSGHASILPPLNPAPCKPMFITARGLEYYSTRKNFT